jgi:hypothetical protein
VRELETEGEESGDKKKSKKEKKRAATEAQLTDARVMYNYVLNFP